MGVGVDRRGNAESEFEESFLFGIFFSVAQMAIAGFGHGLVPVGVARTLAVPDKKLFKLSGSRLTRPVRFVARKSIFPRN